MRLYNTLTRRKEEFVPITPGKVKMYACGPTVYNDLHIGNTRPQIVFDTLRRYFLYRGYDVQYVSNFTDIDDKIIRAAHEEHTDIGTITARYIDRIQRDLTALEVYDHPIEHPTCTGHIHEIIDFIQALVEKDVAYVRGGNVYFRVRCAKDYGKLSGKNIEDLIAGARVEVNEDKEDPLDFLLWKAKKEGEPSWPSPWGEGRPGWHIECSAMARELLGETIDIHAGGEDLQFPHHENEIAQSETLTGKPFAHYWLHNGMINIDGAKMSKSLGNSAFARDFMERESPELLRFFIVGAQYRKPLNFSEAAIASAKKGLARLRNAKERLRELASGAPEGELDARKKAEVDRIRASFEAHMDDDLNTADAISDWYDLAKFANVELSAEDSAQTVGSALALFEDFTAVLGVLKDRREKELPDVLREKIEARENARSAKNFEEADRLRDELLAEGILLKDGKDGVSWEWRR